MSSPSSVLMYCAVCDKWRHLLHQQLGSTTMVVGPCSWRGLLSFWSQLPPSPLWQFKSVALAGNFTPSQSKCMAWFSFTTQSVMAEGCNSVSASFFLDHMYFSPSVLTSLLCSFSLTPHILSISPVYMPWQSLHGPSREFGSRWTNRSGRTIERSTRRKVRTSLARSDLLYLTSGVFQRPWARSSVTME